MFGFNPLNAEFAYCVNSAYYFLLRYFSLVRHKANPYSGHGLTLRPLFITYATATRLTAPDKTGNSKNPQS
jgi:hypothetical protein